MVRVAGFNAKRSERAILSKRTGDARDAADHAIYLVARLKCGHALANGLDYPRHIDA